MDFVKGIKEWRRMCAKMTDCHECPAVMECPLSGSAEILIIDDEGLAAKVEKWSKEHPIINVQIRTKGIEVKK